MYVVPVSTGTGLVHHEYCHLSLLLRSRTVSFGSLLRIIAMAKICSTLSFVVVPVFRLVLFAAIHCHTTTAALEQFDLVNLRTYKTKGNTPDPGNSAKIVQIVKNKLGIFLGKWWEIPVRRDGPGTVFQCNYKKNRHPIPGGIVRSVAIDETEEALCWRCMNVPLFVHAKSTSMPTWFLEDQLDYHHSDQQFRQSYSMAWKSKACMA
jgi:hypothetical protein